MRILLALYALSGLLSLGYQVVWLRHFVDRFGSSTFTFVLVIACFIGGLGAGAIASRRVTARLEWLRARRGELAVYGAVELLVALTALLVFAEALVPIGWLGAFPYALRDGIYEPVLAVHLMKVPLAALSVFVPCFFMGVTYPYLCGVFAERPRFPARLYAWNTLGACSAVLLCEWVLLRRLGHDRTLLLLAAVNVGLGLLFVWRGRELLERCRAEGPAPGRAPSRRPPAELSSPRALLLGAVLSGFLAGAVEADAFRRVHFVQIFNGAAMAFVSFWAILAIYLASTTVHAWRGWRFGHLKLAFAAGAAVFLATTHVWILPLRGWLEGFIAGATERFSFDPDGTGTILLGVFLTVGGIVFPTYFLVSLLLPYLCNTAQREGRHLGRLYGSNTLAFLAGMVVFSWVAPQVNMFYAFKLLGFTFVIAALVLAGTTLRRAPRRAVLSGGGVLLAAAAIWTPRAFDHDYLPDGNPVKGRNILRMDGSAGWTTFIAEQPFGNAIFLDTAKMSDTNPEVKRYMKIMAHFGLLAVEQPRRALLICFGVGNTAASIRAHSSLEEIDIVDLNRNILESAPAFAFHNDAVYDDPRVRLIRDDGRSFLNITDRRYDLITSEPPPPLMHGIDRLYSREYYEAAVAHLTEQGCMTQWLPIYQMPPSAGALIIRTFVQSFPYSLLITGTNQELLLVGSRTRIDLGRIIARFDDEPAVVADLAGVDVPSGVHLVARLVRSHDQLLAQYGEGEVVTDQRNPLSAYWPTGRVEALPWGGRALGAAFERGVLEAHPRLARALSDPRVLIRLVPDFPFESLAASDDAARGVDWLSVQELNLRGTKLLAAGQGGEGLRLLGRSLELLPEQLPARMMRAQALAGAQRLPEAAAALETVVAAFPEYERPRYLLAVVRAQGGASEAAVGLLRQVLERNPRSFDAHVLLANLLGRAGDRDGAVRQLRLARDLKPMATRVLETLARLGA